MNINEIKHVKIIWSENKYLNDKLGADDDDDINAVMTPEKADKIIKEAASKRDRFPYDKTQIEVEKVNGEKWSSKYYLDSNTTGLMDLLGV